MSRNLCKKECDYCRLDEVVITGPIVLFEEYYPESRYRSEYYGMKVAEAACAYCGAKYLAWIEPAIGGRKYNCWYEDEAENRRFYDLSYRSSFNDEPGKDDVPSSYPPSPVELKKRLQQTLEALEPFANFGKAIPDNFKDSQALTITLDMPAHAKGKRGETILDIAVACLAFRKASQIYYNNTI